MASTAPCAGSARGAQRFNGAGPLHDGEAYTAIRNTFAATDDHGFGNESESQYGPSQEQVFDGAAGALPGHSRTRANPADRLAKAAKGGPSS